MKLFELTKIIKIICMIFKDGQSEMKNVIGSIDCLFIM